MIYTQHPENYILVRLQRGEVVTRKGLLELYSTPAVHACIWSMIERGLIRWDTSDWETLLLADDEQ